MNTIWQKVSRREEVGRKNEQRALAAARSLHEEGIFPFDGESTPPELTIANSADDAEGIDLWVHTQKGLVGIQIKSSSTVADKFIAKHRNGTVIPAVIVNDFVNEEALKAELVSAAIWVMNLWFGDLED
jgi:hypothetical protein